MNLEPSCQMLYLMSTMDIIYYKPASLNLMYELPEYGTDIPTHVGVGEDHAFKVFVTCFTN